MDELSILTKVAENGVFALGAFFIVRYFMQSMSKKDDEIVRLSRDTMQAVINNTEALRDLKEQLKTDKKTNQEQHEKLMNMMQIAASSIDNNTTQLQVFFELTKK